MSMTIQEAIRCLDYPLDHVGYEGNIIFLNNKLVEATQMASVALREKAEREDPKPLTIEELRQFDGMPVYLVCESIDVYEWQILDFCGNERTGFRGGLRFLNEVYGMAWIAYRHKPKEG